MISVERAKKLVEQNTEVLSSIEIGLAEGLEYVLSEDVYAPISHPPFQQSAMDGYAVRASDMKAPQTRLTVTQTIAAGGVPASALQPGQAAFRGFCLVSRGVTAV